MIKRYFSFLAACASLFVTHPAPAGEEVTTIRWVLAHEPADLFTEAANSFAREVRTKTGGAVRVEVLTLGEYAKKYHHGTDLQAGEVLIDLAAGKVEMSQTYTTLLGNFNHDLYVLDLPFLFRDYAHAEKVLEGPVGRTLLAGLTSKGIRGLAFTYSGGFRIIPSTEPINGLGDFKGLKLRTSGSPVAQEMLQILGAVPVPGSLETASEAGKRGEIEGTESTYVRFYAMKQNEPFRYVNDTQHSLFLTSIVMSEQFWLKIPERYHSIIRQAALHAGRLERKRSIETAKLTRKRCESEGIPVVDLPDGEKRRFKSAMSGLYEKYRNRFSADYITQIQNQ